MLTKRDTVVVAVSGGVDSVILLHTLVRLSKEFKLSIIAVHLNHGLRGRESDRDEAFVKELAKKLGVKFTSKRIDINSLLKKGDSLQDIAREARYVFFEEAAKRYKADKIATGHNMDDQAETMVMRFLNGSGLRGLCGIPPARRQYIRPLIDITRQEIEKYAEGKRLKFVKDSSNQSARYLRNRIRLKLMPILIGYNPSIKNDMARLSRILARDEDYMEDQAKDIFKDCIKEGARGRKKTIIFLSAKKLNSLHDAIKARIFFMAAEELLGSPKGFYSYHAEDFLKLLSSRSPNASITLPHSMAVYREYDVITIEKSQKSEVRSQNENKETTFEKVLKINGKTLVIADGEIRIAEFKTEILSYHPTSHIPYSTSKNIACFDYDKLEFPLIVRNFRPGDKFVPLGMNGHKKVKELFQEKKIARRRRNKVPILVSGSEIIWVAGMRQAEYGKIRANTKNVLKIETI
ncbi:MAG: tRNA lysidine(34) synthetase TilS [Deltaproteobacteria bacterium]|nr:tRNA lysidine(34) synthetase TilS [Deltaproteobacteria bacterium]